MHRSGTSALTRALNLLGCYLPDDLIGAHETNRSGHWEAKAIVALNDRALDSQSSHWSDWAAVSLNWYRSPLYPDFVSQGRAVVQSEFGENRLFVIKDPRLCRLTPFWLDILELEGVHPVFVLPFRNPIEVAESLARRDGIDYTSAVLMWLRHSLDAEHATRGQTRAITTYEQLLQSPEALMFRLQEELGVIWPKSGPAVMGELRRFVAHDLRHHARPDNSVLDNPALSEWVKDTYAIMLRWAANDQHDADFARLDRIREEFDACLPAFAGLAGALQAERVRAEQLADEAGELRHQIDLATQATEGQDSLTSARAAELQGEVERLRSGVIWGDQARTELEERLRKTEAELATTRQALDEAAGLEAQVASLTAKLETAETDVATAQVNRLAEAELTAQIEQSRERVRQLEQDIAAARDALARHGELEAALEARLRQAETDLAASAAALDEARQAEAEVGQLHAQLRDLEAQRDNALSEIARTADMERELAQSNGRAEQLENEIAALKAALAELEGEAAITRSTLLQRSEEVDQTLAELNAAQVRMSNLEGRIAQALDEIERWRAKAIDGDEWVFRLSAERAALEQKLAITEKALADRSTAAARFEAAAQDSAERVRELDTNLRAAQTANAELAARVDQLTRDSDGLQDRLRTAEAAGLDARRMLNERFKEIAQLSAMLAEQADEAAQKAANKDLVVQMDGLREQLRATEAAGHEAGTRLAAAEAESNTFRRERDERFGEIATMTRLLRAAQRTEKHAEWLREVTITLLDRPSWWRLMPRKWVRRKELSRLRGCGLFDDLTYLRNNPDVSEAKFDPLDHYIIHGFSEGRSFQ